MGNPIKVNNKARLNWPFSKRSFYILLYGPLFGLFSFMVIERFQLHENARLKEQAFDDKRWLQPYELDSRFNDTISNKRWSFDYSTFERRLWLSKYVGLENENMDSDALELIKVAAAELSQNLTIDDLERFRFLLTRMTSSKFANDFTGLLGKYISYEKDYQRIYQIHLEKLARAEGISRVSLLNKFQVATETLQSRYFGSELAGRLFFRKNLTAHYLNQRRVIQMDRTVGLEARALQLEALKNSYTSQLKKSQQQQN